MENSQVIDLRKEPCPMNLVKFKFHFSEFSKKKENFIVILEGEGMQNVQNFLNHKKIPFKALNEGKIEVVLEI